MTLTVPRHVLSDLDAWFSREWLVTNGLGGYASGTLLGAPTRRYHGVFVPDLPAPWGRTGMIPRLDEEAVVEGEPFFLSGVEFDDGWVLNDLPQLLTEFIREWQTPVWRLAVKDAASKSVSSCLTVKTPSMSSTGCWRANHSSSESVPV